MNNEKKISSDTRVMMPGVSAIDYEDDGSWRMEPLLVTDSTTTWNSKKTLNEDQLQRELSKHTEDESGSFTTAVRLSRQSGTKEQRIVVAGDADFFTVFQYARVLPQNVVASHLFHQFTYGKFPTESLKPESTDNSFTITLKDIPKQKNDFLLDTSGFVGSIRFCLVNQAKA